MLNDQQVLEAARVLATNGHRTKATLKFIAFGAEETGLNGSFEYVVANEEEVATKGLGMVNLDMVGVGVAVEHAVDPIDAGVDQAVAADAEHFLVDVADDDFAAGRRWRGAAARVAFPACCRPSSASRFRSRQRKACGTGWPRKPNS